MTRKCWQIIFDNPDLQSLRFRTNSFRTLLKLAPKSQDFYNNVVPFLRPDSQAFLVKTLSRLTRLTELEIGPHAEEYCLRNLGTAILPHVTSFHYSGHPGSAMYTLITRHPWQQLDIYTNNIVTTYDGNNSNNNSGDEEVLVSVNNMTIRQLTIRMAITLSCLRDVFTAYPALTHLTVIHRSDIAPHLGYYQVQANFDETVTTNIEHPTVNNEIRWFAFNIRALRLRTIGPSVVFRSIHDLVETLQKCPELEELHVGELRGVDDDASKVRDALTVAEDVSTGSTGAGVDLWLGRRDDWRECERLKDVRFYLRDPCYGEMNQLLERCSELKTVRGLGLSVKEEDLMEGTEEDDATSGGSSGGWACLGLTELQIEIHGVLRLTVRQEAILLRRQQRQRFDHDMQGDGDEHEAENEQEYEEALEQQRRCESVQRRVLQQLAQLHNLRYLDLSFQPLAYKPYQTRRYCYGSSQSRKDRILLCENPVPDSLSLSLSISASTSSQWDVSQAGTGGLSSWKYCGRWRRLGSRRWTIGLERRRFDG
ncbi:hypothetical protein BGX23_007412 [Mortierella sp. AD031]|nr:hypothetical protein BGX23_007412 [Mortierella sp. AD031]